MSGHPLQRYAEALATRSAPAGSQTLTQSEADVRDRRHRHRPAAAQDEARRSHGVFMLEDEAAKVEAVVFPEAFPKFGGLVVDDAMLLVRGKYERDEETSRLVVARDHAARRRFARTRRARSRDHAGRQRPGEARRCGELADVLDRHPGDRRVSLVVELNGAGATCACARPRRAASGRATGSCATSRRSCGAGIGAAQMKDH